MIGRIMIGLALLGTPLISGQVTSDDEGINPFGTPAPQVASGPVDVVEAPTSLDQFQFNGFMIMDGKVRVSFHDAKANKSFWVHEGQLSEQGLSFQRFDVENETVVIAQGGVNKKLSLNKEKIEPLKIAQSAPAAAPAQAVRAKPAGNVESDEEARARIQRVAEEIRRRRAERRKQIEGQK